jgi:hypothetical protein
MFKQIIQAIAMVLMFSGLSAATTFAFNTDPFAGTNVRNVPGRQLVGGEDFVSFNTTTDVFAFDGDAFNIGTLRVANGLASAIPSAGINVVVLENADDDSNPFTPFGAFNAADLIAERITQSGPGLFIYFNQDLNLPRLVYSTDLSNKNADLRVLARMLNLTGPAVEGVNALATFSAANFVVLQPISGVPEPSARVTATGGMVLLALGALASSQTRRRGQ